MAAPSSLSFHCSRCGGERQVGVPHAGSCSRLVRPPARRGEKLIEEIVSWLWSAEGLLCQLAAELARP